MARNTWTPAMEYIVRKYYPDHGRMVTVAILKDRIPEYIYNRDSFYHFVSRKGIRRTEKNCTRFKKRFLEASEAGDTCQARKYIKVADVVGRRYEELFDQYQKIN